VQNISNGDVVCLNNLKTHTHEEACIRRALDKDIDLLVDICRASFVDSLRWNGSRSFASRWWAVTIESPSCEVWVYFLHEQVKGFVLLVLDEQRYIEESRKRKLRLSEAIGIVVFCPRILAAKILKDLFWSVSSSFKNRYISDESAAIGSYMWIELMAVSPDVQGEGVGKRLLEFSVQRTRALGHRAMMLCVDHDNECALGLYRKYGFTITTQTKHGFRCAKVLSEFSDSQT